jgi:hypothetical protein
MMHGPTYQQITLAIAGPQTSAGGVLTPPALEAHPTSRTMTNGVLGRVEAPGHRIRRTSKP